MEIRDKDCTSYRILFIMNIISIIVVIQSFASCIIYDERILNKNLNNFLIILLTVLVIFFIVYSILFMIKKFPLDNKFLMLLEMVVVLALFSIILFISNGNSLYMPLFLLNIIRASIRKGLKASMFMAFISCGLSLIINLLLHKYSFDFLQKNLTFFLVLIFSAYILGYYVKNSKKYVDKLKNLANKDGLTGLYNHKYFYNKLDEILDTSKKNSSNLSLIIIDADDFKAYNDLNGHQKGDYALKLLANILKESVKKTDIVARYGGEEFIIILKNTSENEALLLAENIRLTVENTEFEGQETQPKGNFTISMGVATYLDNITSTELVRRADNALYRAKFLYKNRVETYISTLDEIKNSVAFYNNETMTSIKTLLSVINSKDKYTYAHTERVVIYAKLMANKLNLDSEDRDILIYGAYTHDVGKINISKELLLKKPPLSDSERVKLKDHTIAGMEIIKDIEALKNIMPLVLHHHERYDGNGYPNRLQGEEIPYLARILTIVDSFDAMTSQRSYNKCKTYEEAKEELISCSGTQFDPELVTKFIEIIDETLKE